jgi:hypothetical protein
MTARRGFIVRPLLAVMAVIALTPAIARAQEQGGSSLFSGLNYCASGGIMSGAGPQGRTLGRGYYGGFNVHGESAIGMQLGLEAAYVSSNDVLNTKFASIGGIARMSPTPEDYRAYVQLGAAVYHVAFSPEAGLSAPPASTRPGGSFGVGLDVFEGTNFSLGGIITYNGVILARSQARSYAIAALTLTFKPSPY